MRHIARISRLRRLRAQESAATVARTPPMYVLPRYDR
jgi:hypothetical protein